VFVGEALINRQGSANLHSFFDQTAGTRWQNAATEAQVMLDDLDRKLIALLRDDARSSIAALAKKLGVSRGTVQNRIARLEKDGTIVGYTVRLKSQADDHDIRAVITIAVEGNRTQSILRALRGDTAVATLHTTNGRWDFVAELRAESLQEFDRVISRISLLDGVSRSETSLLLTTYKD
jgi:DNA-binding Lrp family transcriptional regulator